MPADKKTRLPQTAADYLEWVMEAAPQYPATTPRKKPAMNSPYATQTQIEARIASRLADPERIRRALRLDNPFMWGERKAKGDPVAEAYIPTPTFE